MGLDGKDSMEDGTFDRVGSEDRNDVDGEFVDEGCNVITDCVVEESAALASVNIFIIRSAPNNKPIKND